MDSGVTGRPDRNNIAETKAKSEKLRSEVEHHLATAANTMLAAWNSTNQVSHSPPLTFIIYFFFILRALPPG